MLKEEEERRRKEESERLKIKERVRKAAEERAKGREREESAGQQKEDGRDEAKKGWEAVPLLRRPKTPVAVVTTLRPKLGGTVKTIGDQQTSANQLQAWDSGAEEKEEETTPPEPVVEENWDDDMVVAGFRETREYPMLPHTDGDRRRRYNPNRQLTIDDYEPRHFSPRRSSSPPPQLVDRRPLPPVPVQNRRDLLEIKNSGVMFGGLLRILTDPFVDPPLRTCLNCWRTGHPRRKCPEPE